MIISLSISEQDFPNIDKIALEAVVSELLRSHRRGYHLAVMDRNTCKLILKNLPLSGIDKATLGRVSQEYTQTGGLLSKAPVYICLKPARPATHGEERIVYFTYSEFIDTNISDVPQLLLEDGVNDGKVYTLLLDFVKKRRKYAHLGFRPVHGGGSGTLRHLTEMIAEKRIVATILDSDRKTPLHPVPTKVGDHVRILSDANWKAGVVVGLPCREIENLIPVSVLQLLPCAAQKNDTLNWLREKLAEDELNGRALLDRTSMFFDFKDGLTPDKIMSMPIVEAREWWLERTQNIAVEGFGQNVAAQLASTGHAISEFRKVVLSNGILDFLEDLLEKVIWFFLASSPSRV